MVIENIKKDYGTMSTVVLYRKAYTAEPPECRTHLTVNCQECFKRGKFKDVKLSDLTANELKKFYSGRLSSTRRSKTSVTDYALCNPFSQFITLTFDQKLNDAFNYDHCKKLASKWINNQRRHSPNLTYILVAEKHKSGAIHFHMIVNNFNGKLSVATNRKTGRVIRKGGKVIYNIDGWKYGFSTLSQISNPQATAHYLQKYLTKDFIEAFNKKRYWTSRGLKKPVKTYNIDALTELDNHPGIFQKLFVDEHYYKYTLYPGAEHTRTKDDIRRFASKKYRENVTAH